MKIIISLLICITAIGYSKSHAQSLNLGGGAEIRVEGHESDLVKFYRDNIRIADDDIRNGNGLNTSNLTVGRVGTDGVTKYVAVRHGSMRDLVYCYAIIGVKVYRSPQWRDIGPGEMQGGVNVSSLNAGNIFKVGGHSGGCVFGFDPYTKVWTCITDGNTDFVGSTVELPRY